MPITMELEAVDVELEADPETGARSLAFHDPAALVTVRVPIDCLPTWLAHGLMDAPAPIEIIDRPARGVTARVLAYCGDRGA